MRTASAEARLGMNKIRVPLQVHSAKPAFAKATAGESGERGIRTPGTE